MADTRKSVAVRVKVEKSSDELGILWGWASVADLVDLQGDLIPQEVLVRAVYQFMEDYYRQDATLKVNHETEAEAVLVESTIQMVGTRAAWWVGVKLLSDELREAAKKGEISGFSIGGWAVMEDEEA